ncbi:translocation/assembly module TamB domain-containing protein [Pseudoruegeria sp. SHC-113]|uniref:translocation/assembly module TamB domain-containing protein n=1 Tax=Pseudoruegeria sp. SHC-113 TaxID=2855439 RepID=UPI0021BA629E|nr:translocation/assembly module TamB domain-containing protein [Pseudoruegeria sp. SHC-113]MCT8160710.1 translocation/assembly module TamB domain-containing protein [Pseudoruegeria sp. SHC-113]
MRVLAIVLCLLWPVWLFAQDAETAPEGDGGRISRLIESSLSGPGRQVTVRGFRGALSSRATMEELIFSDEEGPWLILRNAAFDWQRTALLRRRLAVNELVAEELIVSRAPIVPPSTEPPKAAASDGFSLPQLPVSVEINRFALERIEIGAALAGQDLAATLGGRVILIDGEGLIETDLQRLDGPEGTFRLSGNYSNNTRVLSVDLEVAEDAGGIIASLAGMPGAPSLDLTVQGVGPLDDFRADLLLATDGAERLSGQVELLTQDGGADTPDLRFIAGLEGDVAPLFAPTYQDFLGNDLRLSVEGVRPGAGGLDLQTLSFSAASVQLDGALSLGPDNWPRTIALTGAITPPDGAELVRLPLAGPETDLGKLDLTVSFDHEAGDEWTAALWLQRLEREGLALGVASLLGEGSLKRKEGDTPGSVTANLILAASELGLADEKITALLSDGLSATASADWTRGGALNITAFDAKVAGAEASGTAVLADIAEGLNIDADFSATLGDLALYSDIAGLDLGGSADLQLQAKAAALTGAFDVKASGAGRGVSLGDPALDGIIGGESRFSLSALRDSQGTTLRELSVKGRDVELNADGRITEETGGGLRFDARVASLTAEGDARVSGTTLGADIETDLTAEIGDLGDFAALAGLPLEGTVRLTLDGGGNIAARTFDARAQGAASGLSTGIQQVDALVGQSAALDIDIARLAETLAVRKFAINAKEVDVTASGNVTETGGAIDFDARVASASLIGRALLSGLDPAATVEIDAEAKVDDLAPFGALAGQGLSGAAALDLAGRVALSTLDFDIRADGTTDQLQLGIAQVDPLLEGQTALSVDASRAGRTIDIRKLEIDGTQIGLNAKGALGADSGAFDFDARVLTATLSGNAALSELDNGPAIALDATAKVTDLAPFSAIAGQSLAGAADLKLDGTANAKSLDFDVQANGDIRDVAVGIPQVDALLAGDTLLAVDVTKAGREIEIRKLTVNGEQIDLDASGDVGPEGGTVAFDARVLNAEASGQAQVSGMDAGIDVAFNADATVPDLAPFSVFAGRTLAGAAQLALAGQATVESRDFTLTATGQLQDIRAGIADVDRLLVGQTTLDLAAAKQGEEITLSRLEVDGNELDLSASGSVTGDSGRIDLQASLREVAVFVPDIAGGATLGGSATLAGNRINVDLDLDTDAGFATAVDGSVARDFQTVNLNVTGTAPLSIANKFITPRSIIGTAQLDVAVNGPPALSSVSGTVSVSGARFSAPTLKVALDDINTQIRIAGANLTIDAATNVSPEGRVTANGTLNLNPPFNTNLQVNLDAVRLTDPALYDTRLNGQISFVGPAAGGANIGGEINLGKTDIQIPTAAVGAGSVPAGLFHVNETAPQRLTRQRAGFKDANEISASSGGGAVYGLDLRLNAPQRINIRGRGLDIELGGSIAVVGTTARVITEGEFDLIRGHLDFLGKRLNLEEVTISLLGDFTPFIRIVAVADIPDGEGRIVIDGPAVDPDFEFTSTPELPEDEVLAQILFGESISNLSALQAAELASSISELTGGKGFSLISGIRSSLGLDDLNVETDSEGNTTVRAGRYLTDNIYTDIAVDSEGETEINLNLDITDNFTAKASVESDGDSSLGIFFERDY